MIKSMNISILTICCCALSIVLAEQQYGIRKLYLTEYATVKLTDCISKQMESGEIPCNVFIHLSNAFDTLSVDVLLYTLKHYGFTGTELKLLKCYLENRKQYVKYKTYQSEMIDSSTGVPQGSILWPFFILLSFYE